MKELIRRLFLWWCSGGGGLVNHTVEHQKAFQQLILHTQACLLPWEHQQLRTGMVMMTCWLIISLNLVPSQYKLGRWDDSMDENVTPCNSHIAFGRDIQDIGGMAGRVAPAPWTPTSRCSWWIPSPDVRPCRRPRAVFLIGTPLTVAPQANTFIYTYIPILISGVGYVSQSAWYRACACFYARSRAPRRRLAGHVSAAMPLISRPGYPRSCDLPGPGHLLTGNRVCRCERCSVFSLSPSLQATCFLTFEQSIRRTKPPEQRKFHMIYLLDDPTSPQNPLDIVSIIQPAQWSSSTVHKVKTGNRKKQKKTMIAFFFFCKCQMN